ncbi:MAG: RpiB/LacA/LacB family sugar-phosphate isomerase [Bacteroidales bacterium]|nr:RpiB/LacA/LacB family sugar-phosphate isomerase [Candidatus Latescibacterota bacterium]
MLNLVVPVAGAGSRFKEVGYDMPKQLIMVGDKTNIEWSMSCLKRGPGVRTIFIMREDQRLNFAMDEVLRNKFGADCRVVIVPELTRGAAETVLAAKSFIDNDDPLVIYTPDTYFEPHLRVSEDICGDADGHIVTFKANNPAYSYVAKDPVGRVTTTREKRVISTNAAAGVYAFARGKSFVAAATKMIEEDTRTNGEFYICPVYNELMAQGHFITTSEVPKIHLFGTPEEMDFFVTASTRTMSNAEQRVVLCADHSGYELKERTKELLAEWSISTIDCGTFSFRDCDYSAFVRSACQFVLRDPTLFGMGFCRTGQGVNITANSVPGIRAALVFDEYTAEHAIRHNCANFFSVSSKYTDNVGDIIRAWQQNTFDGGRHQNRLQGSQ